ncbi:MAG: 50S ribosomal protein L30 [Promethearchaeota archaeon]
MSTNANTNTDNMSKKAAKKLKRSIPKPAETVCIIRIRGAHGMNRKIQNTLHLLNLYRVNSATVLRTNSSLLGMMQKVKDYVAFGPVSQDSIRNLLQKRALLTGSKPLTNDHIRSSTVYKSIDDLSKAIYDGKIRLNEVKDLKPVFRLHPPSGGFPGSIKKAIGSGGSLGNVGEKINLYLKKMI